MLLDAKQSLVLLIDAQEKLTPLVHDHQKLVTHCHWLLSIAREVGIPIVVSEQYPKGLGHTISSLAEFKTQDNSAEKLTFSCTEDASCMNMFSKFKRNQIVLMGIEAHVCVLQTAIGLTERGFHVFVVVDAVSSRSSLDKKFALKRMKQHGVELITREMAVFEWLKQSGTPLFKTISIRYLK